MKIPGIGQVGLPFGTSGKLEKMKIYGYADAKMDTEVPGSPMEVLINPESYTLDYKLKFTQEQPHGTSMSHLKYEATEPFEMSFDFLLDNTGIIDGVPSESVSENIEKFKKLVLEFKGDNHQPPYVKLVWGSKDGLLKGRLIDMSIQYKMFNPDGKPIRAIIKAKFKQSTEDQEREAREKKSSPDLTHLRVVKAGDTLPLMCKRIYDDPKHYIQIAKYNKLTNFRYLSPGLELIFPPIEKARPETDVN